MAAYPTVALEPGSSNTNEVKKLQDFLVSQGYMTSAQRATGYGTYGPQTTAAVLAYQKAKGVDYSTGPGYWGPRTIAAAQGQPSSSSGSSNQNTNTNQNNTNNNTSQNQPAPQQSQPQLRIQLSAWSSDAQGRWINQPTVTVNGQAYTFNTAGEYANFLNQYRGQLDSAGQATIDGWIGTFNQVQQKYTASQNSQGTNVLGNNMQNAAAQAGFPTTNLEPGMQGAEVEKLQNWLIKEGYMTEAQKATGPGIYGPQTTAAVKAWQVANNVDNSTGPGYWGPRSISAAATKAATSGTNNNQTPTTPVTPTTPGATPNLPTGTGEISTGSPALDAILKELRDVVAQNQQNGSVVNPEIEITPDLVSKFIEEAKKVVNPHTQQLINENIQSINASLKSLGEQFKSAQEGEIGKFGQDLLGYREEAAGRGVAFSGGRGMGEKNKIEAQNRSLGDLENLYGGQIGNVLRSGSAALGKGVEGLTGSMASFQLPEIAGKRVGADTTKGSSTALSGPSLDYSYDPNVYKTSQISRDYSANVVGQSNQFLSNYLKTTPGKSTSRNFQLINGVPTLV